MTANRFMSAPPATSPKPGRHLIVPKADGTLAGVLFGIEAADEPVKDALRPGQLVNLLPRRPLSLRQRAARRAARRAELRARRLSIHPLPQGRGAQRAAGRAGRCRRRRPPPASPRAWRSPATLINTPSNDMGPDELENAARKLAERHGAGFDVTRDNALATDFPLIHAVGMGSPRSPAADRYRLGQGYRSEDHPWSARASVSIPAVSISSLTPACST